MANAHVPKFGNWESEDIPYTAYFDHARQQRPAGGVKINPNDPEENPEAFTMMMMQKNNRAQESDVADHDHNYSHTASPPQSRRRLNVIRTNSNRSTSAEKVRPAEEQTIRHHHHHDHRRARNHRSENSTNAGNITSESGTERSSSDYSLLKKRQNDSSHRHESDHKIKNVSSSSAHGTPTTTDRTPTTTDSPSSTSNQQGHRRYRRGGSTNHSVDQDHQNHVRASSIPKFGSWDVNDPKSGDGFTVIFDKVREEKHINASGKVSAGPPPPPSYYMKDQNKNGRSSCLSKMCCCLFSTGSD